MRKLSLVVIAVIALAVPAAAPAKGPGEHKQASKQCSLGQAATGKHAAKQLRRCEKRLRKAQMRQAKRECRAERRADPAAFAERYAATDGKPGKRRGHVFKRCVREMLAAAVTPTTQALKNAAKECRAMQADEAEEFAAEYGSAPNAFAKCVVAEVQDDGADEPQAADDDEADEADEADDDSVDEPADEPDPDDRV